MCSSRDIRSDIGTFIRLIERLLMILSNVRSSRNASPHRCVTTQITAAKETNKVFGCFTFYLIESHSEGFLKLPNCLEYPPKRSLCRFEISTGRILKMNLSGELVQFRDYLKYSR